MKFKCDENKVLMWKYENQPFFKMFQVQSYVLYTIRSHTIGSLLKSFLSFALCSIPYRNINRLYVLFVLHRTPYHMQHVRVYVYWPYTQSIRPLCYYSCGNTKFTEIPMRKTGCPVDCFSTKISFAYTQNIYVLKKGWMKSYANQIMSFHLFDYY